MKVTIDQSACIECGTCKTVCPQIFDFNEDGKAYILKGVNLEENKKCVKDAQEMCPVKAIIIKE